MEGKNNTQEPVNQPPASRKDSFMQRFAERYPDVAAGDEEGFYGKLTDEFDRFDRSQAAQKELGELLASDPRSAGLLMTMRRGGNPLEYLIEQYGDEFREALNDEEMAKKLSESYSKYAERLAKNKELQEQAQANMQRMLDDLNAAQKEGSFSDEDATKAYAYLYGDGGLLDRIITNDISKDDWMMLMKAANYDAMQADANSRVAEARAEGEIAGRNANIDAQKHRRSRTERMPSDLQGTGRGGNQKRKQDPLLAMLDGINSRNKSVWDD